MAININVGMLGTKETKTIRAMWNLTNKVVLSQTTPLPASPTDGDIYLVPSAAVSNADEIAFRSEGAWLYLVPEAGWMAYVADDAMLVFYNGTEWVEFEAGGGGGGAGSAVELSMFAGGVLSADETIFRHEFTIPVTLPASLAGAQGSSGVAATASAVLSLKKNGTEFGTATWSASGTEPTFVVAIDTAFAASDVFSITAPATPDATLADVSLSILGTRGA